LVIEWSMLLGAAGFLVALIGGVVARDRQITGMIRDNHNAMLTETKTGDDTLHERINRTRDEVSNNYVRRVDLDGHLRRIEKQVSELRHDMKDERRETNKRLDVLLAAIREGK